MIVDAARDIATIAASLPPDQLLDVIGVEDATPIVDVTHDSREVRPGWAFACVVGDHLDGHDFAAQAIDSGAAAVLVSRPVEAPHLLVDGGDDEVVTALGRLARYVAEELGDTRHGPGRATQIVGVTGSSGKTTTKDLIAQVLCTMGTTVAPALSR